MKAISLQLSAFSKNVGTQNETRENIMYNEETKAAVGAQFHCANASVSPATTPSRSIAALPQGLRKAGLLLATCLLYLAPAPAALAQNECGVQNGADPIDCPAADYSPDGITYISSGDLFLDLGPIDAAGTSLGSGGLDISAGGAGDSLTVTTERIAANRHNAAVAVDLETQAGDISFDSTTSTSGFAVIEGAAATEYGIRALTDTGDIDLNVGSASLVASAGGIAAIDAESTGGGDVRIVAGLGTGGTTRGGQYGIRAQVTGDADLTVDAQRGVAAAFTGGVAGLYATTGTGLLSIDGSSFSGGAGTGVLIDAGGDVVFTGRASGDQYGIDLVDVAAGTTSTLNLVGSATGGIAGIRAQGAGEIVVNMTTRPGDTNRFQEVSFDFSGMTGMADPVPINVVNEAIWRVEDPAITVPDGHYDIFIREDGAFGGDPDAVITFQGADRTLTNEGFFVVNPQGSPSATVAGEVRLDGLNEFRHSGRILLGSSNATTGGLLGEPAQRFGSGTSPMFLNRTDIARDDVLVMPGVNWIGEGGEVWMDVDLTASQTSCTDRDPGDDSLAAADCLRLPGATTEGVTNLLLMDRFQFDRGRLIPGGAGILLVDVDGGASAQGHFVVDPKTPGYSPLFGGSLDRGFFQYVVAYDEDAQQHILSGMVNGSAHQQAQLAATAHDLWRTSTATSLDRQADLRDRGADENGGLWLRFANETADRDATVVEQAGSQDFAFDNGFSRDSYAMTMGLDFLSGGSGDSAWIFGFMGGYATSDVDYDVSANTAELNGWSLGTYAGYTAGGLWIDAAINVNELTLRQHIPGMGLVPQDTLISNDLRSVGAQVDAGWRFDLTSAIFVEPLASISHVVTSFDTFSVVPDDSSRPGLDLDWNDPASLRAGLGGRVGTNYDLGFMRGQLSLTAKVWNESDGESVVSIHNNAFPDDPDIEVKDTFDDTVTEITLGASVRSPGNAVSGFVNLGGATSSDYDAFTAKLGVRYQW